MIRTKLGTWHWRSLALLALGASCPAIGFAQDAAAPSPATTDAEWRQQMESRMKQLEQENRELRQTVGTVHDTQEALLKDADSRGIITLDERPDQTTPEFFDLNKYAAQGDFPGSIRIPGSNVSIQIGGYVQVDALMDFDRIGSRDSFIPRTIPVGNPGSGETNLSARQTRLFLKTNAPTPYGALVTYVETDFFGSDNNAELRLRHAYGEVGDTQKFLGGQTWSVFVDAPAFPSTLDQQGAAGQMLTRRPQFRYTRNLPHDFSWAISLEDPNPDIANATDATGESVSRLPALASNIRLKRDWGHLQLAGLLRGITFDPDDGSRETEMGWGLNFTGQFKVYEENKVMFQVAGGNAIADYMNDASGVGLDGFYDGSNLNGLGTFGAVLAYQHWWTKKWDSSFIYSYAWIEEDNDRPDDDYHSGDYIAVNLRWHPGPRVFIGGEVLYGVRQNNGGDDGEAVRVQVSAQYKF